MARLGFTQIRPLGIGDTLPPITMEVLKNGQQSYLKLDDLRGAAIILDFWSTFCSSCIKGFPKMDSLKRIFGDKVHILLVNGQDKKMITRFLAENKYAKMVNLPFVVNDTILRMYFPHEGLPHVVWIDAQGKVKGITSGQYVNTENVEKLVAGNDLNWPVKVLPNKSFDAASPLFGPQSNGLYPFHGIYHSGISEFIPGAQRSSFIDTLSSGWKQAKRLYALNFSIIDLYNISLKYHPEIGRNQIFISSSDSLKYFYDDQNAYKDEWERNFTFCYELVMPVGTADSLMFSYMAQDLDRFFQLVARRKLVEVECLIIKQTRKGKMGQRQTSRNTADQMVGYTIAPLEEFVASLNQVYNIPVIDESYFDESTAIKVWPDTFQNIAALKRTLEMQGLEVVNSKKRMPILRIIEK